MSKGFIGNRKRAEGKAESRTVMPCFIFVDPDSGPILETLAFHREAAKDRFFAYVKRKKPKTVKAQDKLLL